MTIGKTLPRSHELPPQDSLRHIAHWVGGRSVAGSSGRKGPVFNPAAGRQTGEVDFATPEEVDAAVRAAKSAFVTWRAASLAERAEIFFRICELVHKRRKEVTGLPANPLGPSQMRRPR